MDKFIICYAFGTSVCDGDNGEGFLTNNGDLLYLRGILSLSLGKTLTGGTTIFDSNSTITYSLLIQNPTVCTAPPDPENGFRLLHKKYCQTRKDYAVEEGVELVSGSHLIYNINLGYKISGSGDVFYNREENCVNIPVCSQKI
ncbi:hypothetical protein M0804_015519 [Polistes exclamans]|nr:hypothetical protein M0804_015519 [Polistes exclamans]